MTDLSTSSIAAQAFVFLELSPISSFSDDTPQAAQAKLFYPRAFDSCLAYADWSFARQLANLPEASNPAQPVDPDLPKLYVLPADCVKFRKPVLNTVKWRLDAGGYLRADTAGPLAVRYTMRPVNETTLLETFRTAVALQMAVLMAPKWLGTRTKIAELKADLVEALREAARQDAATASETDWHGRGEEGDWASEAMR